MLVGEASGLTAHNLGFSNVSIIAHGDNNNIGLVAGDLTHSTITGVHNTDCYMKGTNNGGDNPIGGVAGEVSRGKIDSVCNDQCTFEG